jgi:type II secretory pathway component PulC
MLQVLVLQVKDHRQTILDRQHLIVQEVERVAINPQQEVVLVAQQIAQEQKQAQPQAVDQQPQRPRLAIFLHLPRR